MMAAIFSTFALLNSVKKLISLPKVISNLGIVTHTAVQWVRAIVMLKKCDQIVNCDY